MQLSRSSDEWNGQTFDSLQICNLLFLEPQHLLHQWRSNVSSGGLPDISQGFSWKCTRNAMS
jgi:hypothetical protein